jgi:hypothetical protein
MPSGWPKSITNADISMMKFVTWFSEMGMILPFAKAGPTKASHQLGAFRIKSFESHA